MNTTMNSNNNMNNYHHHWNGCTGQQQMQMQMHCGFCRRNKEPESIYASHQLKDELGRVTCPQLFKYRCEICGATGQEAHTRSYCPTVTAFRQQRLRSTQPLPQPAHVADRRGQRTISSSSSSSNSSSMTGRSHQPNQPDQPLPANDDRNQNFSIHLGSDRMFRNMRGVTNTRYNSAGKLRRPISGHQAH